MGVKSIKKIRILFVLLFFMAGMVMFQSNAVMADTEKNTDILTETVTGFIENENEDWMYVCEGIQASKTGIIHGYINHQEKDWYVEDGIAQITCTGFVQDGNTWYYIENGAIAYQKNDVIKGIVNDSFGWWYVKNGKVIFTNTVAKNENGWWKITNGKVDFNYTGIARNANGWWRIVNGKVDFNYTGIAKNKNGWWYIRGGKVDFSYSGLSLNHNGFWYVRNGKVDFSYNGKVSYAGYSCNVVNGRVYPNSVKAPFVNYSSDYILNTEYNAWNMIDTKIRNNLISSGWSIIITPYDGFTELYNFSYRLAGLCDYNRKRIYCCTVSGKAREITLLHEVGHFTDYTYGARMDPDRDTFITSIDSGFATIKKNEINIFYNYVYQSSNSSTNQEYFADAFAMYYLRKEALKKYCPNTYNYINKVINNF